ncbi:DUF2797 domain-containing protein [Glutamicibacter sp. X7]
MTEGTFDIEQGQEKQLCHGIVFSTSEPEPSLRLQRDLGARFEPLGLGRTLSMDVSADKWCLGYVRMDSDGSRRSFVCPQGQRLRTGTQCSGCRRRDETKFMHHFHTTGEAPEGLRRYLMQPHFLYVASFAHGVTKVGTTSTSSKFTRLASQGAVVARYVASAPDGAAIRVIEDLVTEQLRITQQVRQKSKIQGLARWDFDEPSLRELNDAAAQRVHELLSQQRSLETYGVDLLDEPFVQPSYARTVIDAWTERRIHPWAAEVPGAHLELRVRGVLGQGILADAGEGSEARILDAAELKTRALQVRPAGDLQAKGQGSLF